MSFSFLLILLFIVFSRGIYIGRSRERCNEAWHYVIQLAVRFCNNFFLNQTSIFVISSFV